MVDKLKEIPGKILEWWNKFTSRQKTIIISIIAIVIFTFAILIYTFSKPKYEELGTYDTATTAEIVTILNDAGITHRESADARTIEVLSAQIAQANLAVASEGYVPDSMPRYGDYVESGMSTTSADRENQFTILLARYLESMFAQAAPVRDVSVMLNRASNSGRLSDMHTESGAYIQLTVTDDFDAKNATAMARAAATALGNESTANITIVDQNMELLFAGGDDFSEMGIAGSVQELQNQAEAMVANKVTRVLLGTNQYQMVAVSGNIAVDYSTYSKQVVEYNAPDGRVEGMIDTEETYNSESENGAAGIPGTDSNGEDENQTGYVNPDLGAGSSSSNERIVHYLPNRSEVNSETLAGSVDYDKSSVAVSMIAYRYYYEDNVRRQGLLDGGITWEDFKEQNREDIKREVDQDYYRMVANATGISEDRVAIIAYESPVFVDSEGFSVSGTDVVSIVMILLILALLGFVVLRTMGPRKKKEEPEEELSVESMLQSTPPEPPMEEINVEIKSEARKIVEKFVDENPEAVANLLRNWLNEDWG